MPDRMHGNVDAGTGVDGEATGQRAPRQERGRRRVDEILDAAEALIVETGPAATSIQEIARRAGASVGSIYHFFPTKDAIFEALRARHDAAAREMTDAIQAEARDAARLGIGAYVERLIAPFAEFIERTPAYFPLVAATGAHRLRKDAAVDAALREATLAALAELWPRSTPAERALRADVMSAIGEGIATLMLHAEPRDRRALVQEMQRAIHGYLATFASDGPPPRA